MKTKTVLKCLILAALSLGALSATAGEKIGNGGVAVVCRAGNGTVISAELLDLFEGVNQMGLTYPNRDLGMDTEIDIAKTKMVANTDFLTKFNTEIANVEANVVPLPHGIGLEPTNDAFPIINKRGCKFENVANYSVDGKIYIDSEIFDALPPVHRAALYVHETVYAIARNNQGDTSSVRARKLTAQVMASHSDAQLIKSLMDILGTAPAPVPVDQTNGIWNGRFDPVGANFCSWQITQIDEGNFYLVSVGRPNLHCTSAGKVFRAFNCHSGYCQVSNESDGIVGGDTVEVINSSVIKYTALRRTVIYQIN